MFYIRLWTGGRYMIEMSSPYYVWFKIRIYLSREPKLFPAEVNINILMMLSQSFRSLHTI